MNKSYKHGPTEIAAQQRLREVRVTITKNKPMTRREWDLLKMAIDANTKTARVKKQRYSCGSHNCLARRTEQYYMRKDEDPAIERKPDDKDTKKN